MDRQNVEMHASSFENMAWVLGRTLRQLAPGRAHVDVLDLGSMDVNGSYRTLLTDPRVRYTGADLEPGPGVDTVLDDPNRLPWPEEAFDLVLSGQMLEHAEQFWIAFAEMRRVLRPDGVLVVIAPSSGPIHQYPVDCYRFYPDAFRVLARLNGLRLIYLELDERGPWRDLVGVFSPGALDLEEVVSPLNAPVPTLDFANLDPASEGRRGAVDYLEVLRQLHARLEPTLYLEIGVRHGVSLALARLDAIGVDPQPDLTALAPRHWLHHQTSDEFFRTHGADLDPKPRLCFIDGLHLFEQVLRDFMNCERVSDPSGAIVIDDVLPNHPAQAARQRRTGVWSGDVWKIVPVLRRYRPDLQLELVDAEPCGLLIIRGLDPSNRVLWENYNPIVRMWTEDIDPPESVLQREGASAAVIADNEPAPELSIVVVSYEMTRELPRTLYTLSPAYQRDIDPANYEIVLVDNGSSEPPRTDQFADLGCHLRLHVMDNPTVSPAAAVNRGIAMARGNVIGVMIDGARMASPGLLANALSARRACPTDVIASYSFHLGHEVQMLSVQSGYDAAVEDALLDGIQWERDGYELFGISVFAGSSAGGWFAAPAESNALFLDRESWARLGGYDERFVTAGGGLVNLDVLKRAVAQASGLTMLLGEGTFHQVHGGVATNAIQSPRPSFEAEYVAMRGDVYVNDLPTPRLFGGLMPQAAHTLNPRTDPPGASSVAESAGASAAGVYEAAALAERFQQLHLDEVHAHEATAAKLSRMRSERATEMPDLLAVQREIEATLEESDTRQLRTMVRAFEAEQLRSALIATEVDRRMLEEKWAALQRSRLWRLGRLITLRRWSGRTAR
jgi:SAM-dependent methyltransferase